MVGNDVGGMVGGGLVVDVVGGGMVGGGLVVVGNEVGGMVGGGGNSGNSGNSGMLKSGMLKSGMLKSGMLGGGVCAPTEDEVKRLMVPAPTATSAINRRFQTACPTSRSADE